jgi:hypothetical protein
MMNDLLYWMETGAINHYSLFITYVWRCALFGSVLYFGLEFCWFWVALKLGIKQKKSFIIR